MKNKALVVAVFSMSLLLAVPAARAGDRVVCKVWLDDGGVVARSTATDLTGAVASRPDSVGISIATLDGLQCPSNRLQADGGIIASDGGFTLTDSAGQVNSDGGLAGCVFCDFRGATSVVMQCRDPVYYSEKWDGGVDRYGQRGVVPATANDVLVDFDINPDGYRIDFRGTRPGMNNHVSVKPVSASASNFCTFSTIERKTP